MNLFLWSERGRRTRRFSSLKIYIRYINILCHSHFCTEQVIYILYLYTIYKLRESAEKSAVRYTIVNYIIYIYDSIATFQFYII